MNLIWTIGAFLLALAPLIVVHELGHYLVARWCGVMVLRFSIGFGNPLLVRRWGKDRTEWAIAAIPFGGYVKMLDEREGVVAADLVLRAFNRQSVWKRMAIVVAGPMANLLLAVVIYAGIFMSGVTDLKPMIRVAEGNSPAALAGFRNGDLILDVDGEPIDTWTELRKALLNGVLDSRDLSFTVESEGAHVRRVLQTGIGSDDMEGDPTRRLGLLAFRPRLDPVIGGIAPGSAAERGGLMMGDVIKAIDQVPISDWEQVVSHVSPAAGKSLILQVERAKKVLFIRLEPDQVREGGRVVGRLGIAVKPDPERFEPLLKHVRYGVMTSLWKACHEVYDTSWLSLRMMGRMLQGEVSVKNLSGPVTIADYAGQSAKLGMSPFLAFIALISISLGVLNLLPVPVLDGGHLMYYLAELLRGRPLSDGILEAGQKIGFGMLGLLMLLALYNDIHRLIAG